MRTAAEGRRSRDFAGRRACRSTLIDVTYKIEEGDRSFVNRVI